MYFSSLQPPRAARSLPLYQTLICAACVLILVINGISLLRNLDAMKAANVLYNRTGEVSDQLQHLNLLVTDAESNLRGYFLSGAPSYLSAAQGAPAKIARQLETLARLLADNPSQRRNLAQMRALVEQQLRRMEQAEQVYRSGGLEQVLSISGQPQDDESDEIRLQAVIMISEQSELLAARSAAFSAQHRHAVILGLGINAAAIVVLLLFYRLVQSSLRARAYAEQALQLANDELESTVARRTEQLSVLSRHLIHVSEKERARLARELHDEMGANLTAIGLDLQSVTEALQSSQPDLAAMLVRARATLIDTVQLKRRIVEDLRPSLLDNMGLAAALQSYCDDYARVTGLSCDVLFDGEVDCVGAMQTIALFRIVQEALNNVAKYAKARSVIVHLAREGDVVTLEITDDGIGIAPQALRGARTHGLLGMRERALLLGGELEVGPGVNQVGTCVRARIPAAVNGAAATPSGSASEAPVPSPVMLAMGNGDLGSAALSAPHQ